MKSCFCIKLQIKYSNSLEKQWQCAKSSGFDNSCKLKEKMIIYFQKDLSICSIAVITQFYTLCYEIPCMTDITTCVYWAFWPLHTRAAAALHHTYTQGHCQFVKWNKGYLKVRISAAFQVQTLFQTFITWNSQSLVQIGELRYFDQRN